MHSRQQNHVTLSSTELPNLLVYIRSHFLYVCIMLYYLSSVFFPIKSIRNVVKIFFFKLLDGEKLRYKQKYAQWTEEILTPLTNIDDPYSVNRENEM